MSEEGPFGTCSDASIHHDVNITEINIDVICTKFKFSAFFKAVSCVGLSQWRRALFEHFFDFGALFRLHLDRALLSTFSLLSKLSEI